MIGRYRLRSDPRSVELHSRMYLAPARNCGWPSVTISSSPTLPPLSVNSASTGAGSPLTMITSLKSTFVTMVVRPAFHSDRIEATVPAKITLASFARFEISPGTTIDAGARRAIAQPTMRTIRAVNRARTVQHWDSATRTDRDREHADSLGRCGVRDVRINGAEASNRESIGIDIVRDPSWQGADVRRGSTVSHVSRLGKELST